MTRWSAIDRTYFEPRPTEIYLNNQPVAKCREADEEQGYVILLVPGRDGDPLVIDGPNGPEVVQVRLEGVVEIEYAAEVAPDGTLVN